MINKRMAGKKRRANKLQPFQLDTDHPRLRQFFLDISRKFKLDPKKLRQAIQAKFHEQSDAVFAIIAKLFQNFESTIHFFDYRKYCDVVKRFASIEIASCRDIFFNFVDANLDKRVCEIDIF